MAGFGSGAENDLPVQPPAGADCGGRAVPWGVCAGSAWWQSRLRSECPATRAPGRARGM